MPNKIIIDNSTGTITCKTDEQLTIGAETSAGIVQIYGGSTTGYIAMQSGGSSFGLGLSGVTLNTYGVLGIGSQGYGFHTINMFANSANNSSLAIRSHNDGAGEGNLTLGAKTAIYFEPQFSSPAASLFLGLGGLRFENIYVYANTAISLDSSGVITFSDAYKPLSFSSTLKLSSSSTEWEDYETNFGGEVSLLNAINQAYSNSVTSLQGAYDGGSTILTNGSLIEFTLSDGSFAVEGDGYVQFGGTTPLNYFSATASNLSSIYGGSVQINAQGPAPLQGDVAIDAVSTVEITSQKTSGTGINLETLDSSSISIKATGGATSNVVIRGIANNANAVLIDNSGGLNGGITLTAGTSGLSQTTTGTFDILATGAGGVNINASSGTLDIGNEADAQNINIGTGAAARKITIGNSTGATEVEINTGTVGFDVNALGPIALDGVGASNLTASAGNLTLSTTTSGTIAVASAGPVNISGTTGDWQSTGAVTIDSSGGAISIGSDADAQAINIGTGAAARNISIGNTTASTDIQVLSTTGNIARDATGSIGTRIVKWDSTTNWFGGSAKSTNILSSGTVISCYSNGNFEINMQAGSGSITIGGGGTGPIYIGASAFGSNSIQIGTATNSSRTITIGNGTGSSPVTISSGTGGIAIGTNAVARSVDLGTGSAAQIVTVGSTNSTSSTTIQAGTGGVSISGTTFTVTGGSTISIGATAVARTVNLGTGAAAQSVNVGSTDTTSTTTISAGTGGITLSAPTTTVTGDLIVQGTTTSLSSETVLISDNFLYLNQGYATATAVTGGIIVNYEPTSTSDTVATGGFTAGVASTSNPTVATTGAATFSLGDIIQINGTSDPDNNGLFEVLSHSSNVLTIRGIGTTSTVETFTQDQFDTSTVVAGTITKVNIAVLRVNTSGSWESAYGSSTPLTFSALGGGAAQDYDLAGEAAGTPAALSNVYNFISGRAWTLKASGHAAACLSAPSGNTIFTIKKNGSSIGTVTFTNANTSGTVQITSAPTDVSFSIGDIFSITAPLSLNSIDTPYWTFLGTRP